ncbi:MAG: ATP-binding protein [Pseudomonadota bacterium]
MEGTRRFTAFIRNLTEQKQLEARLLEGERQFAHLSRLRILGELASGIAHELNQPLNAISVLSSLAEMTDDPAELKQALLKIGTFTDRAGELIKHFRNLSSANEQARSPSNINELIQRAVQFLDNEITHHGVSLEFRLAPDLPELEIVPIEIEQITLNLVQNALEAMADQSTPCICITTEHNSENLTVSVTNSGAVELDDNIFEAFKTTKSNGLGIGLTVCRSNIENHGGRIWLEPQPDNTTFRFSLPLSL